MNLDPDLGKKLSDLYGGETITSTREGGEYVIRLGFRDSEEPDCNVLARHRKLKVALKIAIDEKEAE